MFYAIADTYDEKPNWTEEKFVGMDAAELASFFRTIEDSYCCYDVAEGVFCIDAIQNVLSEAWQDGAFAVDVYTLEQPATSGLVSSFSKHRVSPVTTRIVEAEVSGYSMPVEIFRSGE